MSTIPPPNESYEFTEEQNGVIGSLAFYMRFCGIVMLVAAGLQFVVGLLTITRGGFVNVGVAIISLIVGVLTLQAASGFRRIVDTRGKDIGYLMQALQSLRTLYRIQTWMIIIALILGVVAVVVVVGGGVVVPSSK